MTAELPEGFYDPVASTRVARLHAEVQRLAHSSPPVVGRDRKIRELKAAVAILRDYQSGFTSFKWCLSIYRKVAAGLVVAGVAILLFRSVSSSRKLPPAGEFVRVGGYMLTALVAVGAWDFLKTRRRLRMAEVLADSLLGAPGSSTKHEAGYPRDRTDA